jgi:hypothetical protein
VNAAGATAISGAVLKAGSIGYFAHDSVNPAPTAADASSSDLAASDSWFDHGGNISATDDASQNLGQTSDTDGGFTTNVASNSAGNTSTGQANAGGDDASLDAGTDGSLANLAVEGFNVANVAAQSLVADLFYADLGSA